MQESEQEHRALECAPPLDLCLALARDLSLGLARCTTLFTL